MFLAEKVKKSMVLQSPEKEPSLWVEVDFRVYLEAHTLPLF